MKKNLFKGNCLKGFQVHVEVGLESGVHSSKGTLLYWGKYLGIVVIGKREMIVLKNGVHFNRAEIQLDITESNKVNGKLCLIDLEKIISIDVTDEKFNLNEVDLSSHLT